MVKAKLFFFSSPVPFPPYLLQQLSHALSSPLHLSRIKEYNPTYLKRHFWSLSLNQKQSVPATLNTQAAEEGKGCRSRRWSESSCSINFSDLHLFAFVHSEMGAHSGLHVTIGSCSKCLNCFVSLFYFFWYLCPGDLTCFAFSGFFINQQPFLFRLREFLLPSSLLMGSFLVHYSHLQNQKPG